MIGGNDDNFLIRMLYVEWKGMGEWGWIGEISNIFGLLGFFIILV